MSTSKKFRYLICLGNYARLLLIPWVVLSASCSDGTVNNINNTEPQASAANPLPSTLTIPRIDLTDVYQWRVRALDAHGAGAWALSDWFSAGEHIIPTREAFGSRGSVGTLTTASALSGDTASMFSDAINVNSSSIYITGSLAGSGDSQTVTWTPVSSALGYEVGLRSRITDDWLINDVYKGNTLCSDSTCVVDVAAATDESGHPPEIVLSQIEFSGDAPLIVSINADQSTDLDGDSLRFHWSIEGRFLELPTTSQFSHTFNEPGIYKLWVSATDSAGLNSREFAAITVTGNEVSTPAAALPTSTDSATNNVPNSGSTTGSESSFNPLEVVMPVAGTDDTEQNTGNVETIFVAGPIETTVVDQPVENVVVGEPEETVGVGEPEETVGVGEPEETVGVGEPEETVAAREPVETVFVSEPVVAEANSTITPATTTDGDKIQASLPPEEIAHIDQTAPNITTITVDAVTATSARVKWALDEYATGQINYGTTQNLGFSTYAEASFAYAEHAQTIRNLEPNTNYYFQVSSMDEGGNSVVSPLKQFKTLAVVVAVATSSSTASETGSTVPSAATPTDYAAWANAVSSYDENRAMGGLFYGNPQAGGYGASNSTIGTDQAVRFRSPKTGAMVAVKVQNRYLRDSDIYDRCEKSNIHSRYEFYCDCIDAGLVGTPTKNNKCMYHAPGSGYMVGNGGTYDIEIREVASNGWPDFSKPALGTSLVPHIPIEHAQASWDEIKVSPAPLVAGKEYFIVFKNKTPPPGNVLWGASIAEAAAMPDNAGAMSLNGLIYDNAPDTSKRHGPYFGPNAHRTYYSRDNRRTWNLDPRTVGWWVAKFEDGLWIGQTHAASDGRFFHTNDIPDDIRVIGGNIRGRQHLQPKANFNINGVWVNYGHEANRSNGKSMSLQLKNSAGTVIASASFAHNAALHTINKEGVSPFSLQKYNAKTWHYADLNTSVSLNAGESYTVEVSAATGAGFVITAYETGAHGPKVYTPEQILISDIGGFAEASTNGGSTWIPYGKAGTLNAHKNQLPVLFTTVGGPKSLD